MTTTTKFIQETELTADNCMKGVYWSETLKNAGWQPMKTAPKNGRAVLLYETTYGGKCYVMIGHYANGWVADSEMYWSEDGPEHCSICPTHWMPLPEPPTIL